MIIVAFKNKIFSKPPTGFEDDVDEDELLKRPQEKDGRLPTIEEEPEDADNTLEQLKDLDKIYAPLIKRYFMENSLIKIMNKLKKYKENPEKLQMYNDLVTRFNIGLERLENGIQNMPEDRVAVKKRLDCLKDLVRNIVDVNQKDNMPPLEAEEEAGKRQKGQGLKIMTPKNLSKTIYNHLINNI